LNDVVSQRVFGVLVCLTVIGGVPATASQQTQAAQPSPQQSIGQQAVGVVLDHYKINPRNLVPKTGKPLPPDGAWAIGKDTPDSCPKMAYPCVRVLYKVPAAEVSCEWIVLLRGRASENAILDLNEDAARYLNRIREDGIVIHALNQPAPIYPLNAKVAHSQGAVKMLVHIAATGHVDKITVISGPDLLRDAASAAVKQWVYSPPTIDSIAVPFQTTMTINFGPGGS
jgi:TonB family protein